MTNKEYVDSIDKSLFRKGIIAAVLYDELHDAHYYLFDFETDEEGYQGCVLLCEPINKEFPYVEMSLPFLDTLDYYDTYKPDPYNPDIGKHYKSIMPRLKEKEARLLKL